MSNDVHQQDGHGPSQDYTIRFRWVLVVTGAIMAVIVVASQHAQIAAVWSVIAQHRLLTFGLLALLTIAIAPAWIKWHHSRIRRGKLDPQHTAHRRPRRS